MSFETFKNIFHKLPRTLTQIAFGIGNINSSPDLRKIFDYCRDNDYQYIVPNVTINGFGMTPEWYDYLAKTLGACAVSNHHEDSCFNAVKELTDRGMTQINIHQVVSLETFDICMSIIDQVQLDPRLNKLNAVVFLMLKQKGRGKNLNRLPDDKYKLFIEKLFASGISFGMDSCGASRLLAYGVSDEIKKYITPCESTRESAYINVKGEFFPCSFTEGTDSFPVGIDITKINNFVEEVWMSRQTHDWRQNLLSKCNNCPIYQI
jgi:radical SAM protein with 4Fe4S-binding SPASM domain